MGEVEKIVLFFLAIEAMAIVLWVFTWISDINRIDDVIIKNKKKDMMILVSLTAICVVLTMFYAWTI